MVGTKQYLEAAVDDSHLLIHILWLAAQFDQASDLFIAQIGNVFG